MSRCILDQLIGIKLVVIFFLFFSNKIRYKFYIITGNECTHEVKFLAIKINNPLRILITVSFYIKQGMNIGQQEVYATKSKRFAI